MSQDDDRFTITTAQVGGTTVVRPRGAIDLATAQQFRAELDACSGAVVLDLAGVTFLDSSGLHAILATHRRLNDTGSFVLRDPQSNVRRAIKVVGIEHLLEE